MCSHRGKATYAQDKQKSCGGRRQTTAAETAQEAGTPLCLGKRVTGLGRHACRSFPVAEFRFNATNRHAISRYGLSRCTRAPFSYNDAVVKSQWRYFVSPLQLKHGTQHCLRREIHQIKDIDGGQRLLDNGMSPSFVLDKKPR